ncbi:MAG: radical SAM protein [Candidatus Bathyarchaeia archaeon]
MIQFSPEKIWKLTAQELLDLLDTGVLSPKSRTIHFYAPSFMQYRVNSYCSRPNQFYTISVTGRNCTLNCLHCSGKVLSSMHPAETPEELFNLCAKLKQNGASGCLISGGCMPNGSVPLRQFIPVIEKITGNLGLNVVVHTGIVDSETAHALGHAGIDAALIDIIGSDETIKAICNFEATVEAYTNSLKALQDAGLNIVPHVIVGLHYGRLKGEFHALEIISRYKFSALVVIALMPIRGTVMELIEPPKPIDIARVVAVARAMFSDAPIALGCMRPKGRHRADTDILCLKAGVDAVAFPSEEAVFYAEKERFTTFFSSVCCSNVFVDKVAK